MMFKKISRKNIFVTLTLLLVLALLLPNIDVSAALPVSDLAEDDLTLSDLSLLQATTTLPEEWSAVPGDFADRFVVFLDPAEDYYLNVADLVINGTLADAYHAFYIDTSSVDAGYYTYWFDRGVYDGCTGTWQPTMWQIINGDLPFFYLKVSASGTVFKLVDGLKYILYPGQDLPLYIEGTYWLGESSFIGSVRDTLDRTDDVSVDITFNDQPAAQDGTATTLEDTPVAITLNATDTFPGTLSWETSDPPHGTVTGINGSVTYTPDPDWFGTDSFTFTVDDGHLGIDSGNISVTVTAVNDPPVAYPQSVNTLINTPLPIVLFAEDVESDPLTWFRGEPSHGTLSGVLPNLTYTPNADYIGPDSFIFYVDDGQAQSNQATVSIMVYDELAVSEIELGQSLDKSTWEAVDGNLGAGYSMLLDPIIEYYYLTALDITANRPIDEGFYAFYIETTSVPEGFYEYWELEREVYEGCPGTYEPIMWQIISGANPIFYLDVTDTGYMLVDGLIYQLTGLKEYLRINGDYWPGVYTFSGTVADEFGFTDDLNVQITFDDRPLAEPQSLSTDEDTALAIILTGEDHYGDPLTYTVVTPPANGDLTGTAPDLIYTPHQDFNGADSFTFKVNDGTNDSAPATIVITVNPVNDPPVADDQSVETDEDEPVAIVLTASDVDGDPLIFTIVAEPLYGTLSGVAPDLTYTPDADYNGTDSFTFTASDAVSTSDPATISITIHPVEDLPIASDQDEVLILNIESNIDIILLAYDADGDPLTPFITQLPAHGALTIGVPDPMIINYKPEPDFTGTDSFKYYASDGKGTSNEATVTIEVLENRPPVADSQAVSTDEDTPLEITLTATDPDGDRLRWRIVELPVHGTLVYNPVLPDLIYTPDPDYHGTDAFTFRAMDGYQGSNIATVTITIHPVNDAPVAHEQTVATANDTDLAITLTATDVDGDDLIFAISIEPEHGTLTADPADSSHVIYTPDPDFLGFDSFTFEVSDGTLTDTAVVTIEVTEAGFFIYLPLIQH